MSSSVSAFGSCWSCVSDLTMPARMASGNRVVAEAILRRWSTAPGELIDDPEYGYKLLDLIGADLGPADLAQAQQQASDQAQQDERVLACTVQMTLDNVTQILTVNAQVTTAAGPFTMVVAVSAVTTALLLVSP